MKQVKKQAEVSVSTNNVDLAAKLAEIEKQPATRVVRLVYKSCCGCGCSDIDITREVPYDSPLKNGDRIKKLEKNDK